MEDGSSTKGRMNAMNRLTFIREVLGDTRKLPVILT
jgi:hypothetical protein